MDLIVSPGEGRRPRHPDGRLVEPNSTVQPTPYWARALLEGDVVIAAPAATASSKPPAVVAAREDD